MHKSNWLRSFAVAVVFVLLARCVTQAVLPLMHQEAYYWMYAQHPSLSYYDHPPMVAWMIGGTTAVVGNSEWGVRLGAGLLMLLNSGLMYAFARQWWGRGVALAAALLLELSPVYFGIGLLATMDAPLLTCWLLSLIGFSLAVRGGPKYSWYLCGFGLGGALLSKYTGVFLIAGVGGLLLAHKPWRKHLASPHPYLAAALGLAMFGPVLLWNYRHDWVSFRFQFLSRFAVDISPHRHTFIEFVGMQVAVATPVVIGGLIVLFWRGGRRRRWSGREKLALAFAVPLLLAVAKKAVNYPVHIDWTAPAYVSLMPAAIHLAAVRVRARRSWPAWLWRHGAADATLRSCLAIDAVLVVILMVVQPSTHWLRLFGPWDEIAAQVEHYEDALETSSGHAPLVIVDGKYELASLIAFYRNRLAPADQAMRTTVNQVALGDTALGYAYWTDPKSWNGRDCIFVDTAADAETRLAGRFQSVKVKWSGVASNGARYTISECRGYRG